MLSEIRPRTIEAFMAYLRDNSRRIQDMLEIASDIMTKDSSKRTERAEQETDTSRNSRKRQRKAERSKKSDPQECLFCSRKNHDTKACRVLESSGLKEVVMNICDQSLGANVKEKLIRGLRSVTTSDPAPRKQGNHTAEPSSKVRASADRDMP